MITKKELSYINSWASRVPYPGREYCEGAMKKLEDGLNLYNSKYANRKYNITFSNQEEIELEIMQKNICHMLGIDYKNLTGEYFDYFRRGILGIDPNIKISSYDMLELIVNKKEEILDYDDASNGKAINYYKVCIKADIFRKLADISKFNYGCINFDKDKFLELHDKQRFSANSTKFLYTESDESISPYFLMGLKKELDNSSICNANNIDDEYIDDENNTYIVETLIAPEHVEYFFDGQEVVIPTQILTDINGNLNKVIATPEEKIKLLKGYKSIINQYKISCNLDICGDYLSCLMEEHRQKSLKLK